MAETVFITGTSTGIGRATAGYFAERGWNVAATMRDPGRAGDLGRLENVQVLRLDVARQSEIDDAVDAAIGRFGRVDVLVNNAGFGLRGLFEGASAEQIRRQYDTNVFGLMEVIRAFLPHFRANRSGHIVNVGSIAGRVGDPLMPIYSSSKWAVEGFSEALSHEVAPLGILVKLIEPGAFKTAFQANLDTESTADLSDYEEIIAALEAAEAGFESEYSSDLESVVETIYEASTSTDDRLRYLAGADAEQLWAERMELGDEEFVRSVRTLLLGEQLASGVATEPG